jgi:hypothetical protein
MQVSFYLMDVTLSFFCQTKFVNRYVSMMLMEFFFFFFFVFFFFFFFFPCFIAWYILHICITWSQICRKADRPVLRVGPSL